MIQPVNIDKKRFRKFGKKYTDGLHLGYDFDCPYNTEVKAIEDGIVLDSREINGFGSLNPSSKGGAIFIQHGDMVALYGHVIRFVSIGEKVKEGQVIGTVRPFTNNGESLPHLHFGIWNNSKMPPPPYGYDDKLGLWVDPILFLGEIK